MAEENHSVPTPPAHQVQVVIPAKHDNNSITNVSKGIHEAQRQAEAACSAHPKYAVGQGADQSSGITVSIPCADVGKSGPRK